MTSLTSVPEFEREISGINSEVIKLSCINEELMIRFNFLQKQFKVKSSFLSGYQLKQLREKINKLSQIFESLKAPSATSEDFIIPEKEIIYQSIQLSPVSEYQIKDSRSIVSNLSDANIVMDITGDVLIEGLCNVTIVFNGDVNSLRIRNVIDSKIDFNGICSGPVYIEKVSHSTLSISGDQIRLHECMSSKFLLCSKSTCILEDCDNLRIGPNIPAANKLKISDSDVYWKCIIDFGFDSENSFKYIDLIDE